MKFFALSFLALSMGCLSACSSTDDDSSENNNNNNNKEETTEISKLTLLYTNNLTKLGLPHGSYSGITPVGNGEYAIVDDHALYGGIFTLNFTINDKGVINEKTLNRTQLEGTSFCATENYGGDENWRDPEGIVYHPSTDTYFVAHERYQKITEYNRKGKDTGTSLNVPEIFDYTKIQEAFGFESLAYNANTGLFWTTTEKALTADMTGANDTHKLRLQSFDETLNPSKQLIYQTDTFSSSSIVQGVSDILALDNGMLIVIEREVNTAGNPTKYYTSTHLYLVDPRNVADGGQVTKTLLTGFTTDMGTDKDAQTIAFADYEGICLGPKLSNGKQTVLLLADTQNGTGYSSITMQEYLKVFVLE